MHVDIPLIVLCQFKQHCCGQITATIDIIILMMMVVSRENAFLIHSNLKWNNYNGYHQESSRILKGILVPHEIVRHAYSNYSQVMLRQSCGRALSDVWCHFENGIWFFLFVEVNMRVFHRISAETIDTTQYIYTEIHNWIKSLVCRQS